MAHNLHTSPRLSSGDQDVVSLINGFGYSGGPTPAVFQEYPFSILDTSFTALAWNFVLAVNGSFLAGFGGPGWGTGSFGNELAIGTSPDDFGLSLGGGAHTTEAGFLVGAQLKFAIRVNISGWAGVRWVGGWDGYFENIWGTITDVNSQITIDAIALVLTAIEFLIRLGQGGELAEITKKLKPAEAVPHAGWGLTANTSSPIETVASGNTTSLLPQLVLKLDLAQFITPVRAFNTALSAVGSEVQFGPQFGIGFPIHIQVEGVIVDNAVFGVNATRTKSEKTYYDCDQNQLIEGSGDPLLHDVSYRPQKVGLRYKWSWGVDMTLGVYARVTIFYVLSIAPAFSFGLLELLGINADVNKDIRGDLTNGNFAYQSNQPGSSLAQATPQPIEVVFEEPDFAWS